MVHHSETPSPAETEGDPPSGSFWRSSVGKTTIVALAASALLLGYEYRATIFAGSLAIWLPLLLCIGMHAVMHRRHRGHGHRSAGRSEDLYASDEATSRKETE